MSAPKGNKNALGNKGGRRPSEKEMEWHKGLWENDQEVKRLEAKIASGKYAARDVYALKVLKADTAILKNLADKILADLHDIRGRDGEALQPTEEQIERILSRFNRKANGDEAIG